MPEDTLARQVGPPTASQLEKINALAKRPLSKEEVFTFPTKMVGDALIYHPWPVSLHKSLLEVFKQDALAGVSFMLDHPWAGFGRPKAAYAYGRTFDARLKKGDIEGENWAAYGDVYIVRGKKKDGVSTDSIIADIEDGTLFDVSVGFGNSLDECSICGNNIWDGSKCEHWPGKEYDGELCYIVAKPPGYLMELSGVFDGAYPSAEILSAVGAGESASDFQPIEFTKLARPEIPLYRIFSSTRGKLLTFAKKESLEGRVLIPGATLQKGGEITMDEKEKVVEGAADAIQDTVTSAKIEDAVGTLSVSKTSVGTISAANLTLDGGKILDVPRPILTQEQANIALGKEYTADEILKFAKEGIAHHAEVVDDAIAWGVRAQGNDFPAETWKATFAGMGTSHIKDIMKTFQAQAKDEIPAGRHTDPEAGNAVQAKPQIPDEAYKA